MKVYVVESLECDWETETIREGIFSSLEKAEKFTKSKFENLDECNVLSFKYLKHWYSGENGRNDISVTIEEVEVL